MENSPLIYGIHPVKEAMLASADVIKITIQQGLKGESLLEIRNAAKERGIQVQYVPVEKMNHYVRNGNHQGVIAWVSSIQYQDYFGLVESLLERGKAPFILLLDKVTDVRNVGAIARTAECAGIDAIVVPDRGGAQLNADAVKTSAGALLKIPICKEGNLKTVINFAKQQGFTVCAATEKGDKLYTEIDFCKPCLLLLGSEDLGISNEYLKMCDQRAQIPIRGTVSSLNVSVAAGIIIYEALKQRS